VPELDGKVALVTGSGRNIGREIAAAFVREGAAVVVNARESADELAATEADLRSRGGRVLAVLADVSKRAAVDDLVSRALEAFGRIDVLVLNHSRRPAKPLLELTDEDWQLVVGTNLDSALYLLQAVLPGMVERGDGCVLVCGRGSSGAHAPLRAHYSAAVEAKNALVRAAMYEFSPLGIRFDFVRPGLMSTVRKNPEWYPGAPAGLPQLDPEILRHVPLGHAGDPATIGDACVFLASGRASYVNGQTLGVDGGMDF
jgi:3-oxoacyl-[acyl-carrier protein] reductase